MGRHGEPSYEHPRQPPPGHVVGLSWDSALPKFGIDRGAGVWSDLGTPASFRLGFGFAEPAQDLKRYWKGQTARRRLARGRHDPRERRHPLRGGAVRVPTERSAPRTARRHSHGPASESQARQPGLPSPPTLQLGLIHPSGCPEVRGGLAPAGEVARRAWWLSEATRGGAALRAADRAGAATLVVRDEERRGDRPKTYRTKVAELSLPVDAGGRRHELRSS